MRILFFGTSAFAVPSLERLVAEGFRPLVCMTSPDRPQGRGLKPLPSPVKLSALQHGVSVEEPTDLQAVAAADRATPPDVGVVISYGRLLPSVLLKSPRHGMLGVHPSLLPRYRGANPIAAPILHGDRDTGVTIFRLNERMDAGEMACQETMGIEPRDTTATLSDRLAHLGAELLIAALRRLEQGALTFQPQDERLATSTEKFTKADGQIDWTADAAAIDRLVRATQPWPGASTSWHGVSLKLWAVELSENTGRVPAQAGTVVAASREEGLVVAAGQGAVHVRELQPAGKRRMTAAEFLAGHRVHIGEIFT